VGETVVSADVGPAPLAPRALAPIDRQHAAGNPGRTSGLPRLA
jgi:hypothetical protein